MIVALITGSLFRDPEQRTGKSGKQFVTGTIRAKTSEVTQYVRFVAFSENAQGEIMRLQDSLSIQGSLKAEIYAKNGGEPKVSLSIVADHVLALRKPPKESRPKAPEPQATRARAPADFDDRIPFGAAP